MPWIEISKENIIFDPKVRTYCYNPNFKCPNYGNSWACPPKAPYLEKQIILYTRFFLIYIKQDIDMNKKEVFESMRDRLEEEITNFIKEHSRNYKQVQILWDGYCRLCEKEGKKCTIKSKLPCRYPDEIRYSMEAIGINVTETVRRVELDIEWPPKNHIYRVGLICVN
jgi:predicted metal-binding protein